MQFRLHTLVVLLFTLFQRPLLAQDALPLTLIGTTPLPEISGGDFDHFAVDLKHNRLYVVAEVYGSIEVFDLRTGKHLQSARGVIKSPRKIVFLEDKGELLVADAGNASCEFLDATDLHLVASIPLEPGPDAGVYDPLTRTFFVGNGGRAAHLPYSYVSEISVDTHKVVHRTRLEASTLKTILLDTIARKLYVSMRDTSQVGVIDLQSGTVRAIWSDPQLHTNSAMAYDQMRHRLFLGDRDPGKLVVLNTTDGSVVTTIAIGNTSDDMEYDAPNKRIYIASADGVDVVSQQTPDRYRVIQHVDTLGGKTCLYVLSRHRLFVVHTKSDKADVAALQIFEVK
jgi:DNA-binding beta-propeller fold protein YncE